MTVVRRLLALSCAIVLVDTIFYAALTPLVPLFEEEFGLSKSVVGILSGAYGAGVLVGSVPGGYLASRSGVRITALVGLILMSVTSVMFAIVDTTWLLVAVRFAGGFGSALSWVAAFTWLVDRAPEERRAEMIGVMISAAVVGALLGPVLGSVAATRRPLAGFRFRRHRGWSHRRLGRPGAGTGFLRRCLLVTGAQDAT